MQVTRDAIRLTVDTDQGSLRSASLVQLSAQSIPDTITLAALKESLKKIIDDNAEQLRLSIITPGMGQALEYQETSKQAVEALADKNPTADHYPMLAASIGVDVDPNTQTPATDVMGVARAVQHANAAWIAIGAPIRKTRLWAKKDIDMAVSIDAAITAFNTVSWPDIPTLIKSLSAD